MGTGACETAVFLFCKGHEALGEKQGQGCVWGQVGQEAEAWPLWEKTASRVEVAEDRRGEDELVLACSLSL